MWVDLIVILVLLGIVCLVNASATLDFDTKKKNFEAQEGRYACVANWLLCLQGQENLNEIL